MKYHIDFETFSEAPINKVGAWAYAAHPTTQVICLAAYAPEQHDEPILLKDPIAIKQYMQSLLDGDSELHAWNSFFEMAICYHVLGIDNALDVSKWTDTAASAAVLALPRALGACAIAMGMPEEHQKDKRGKYLIQRLCQPYRGKRNYDRDLLEELYAYCKQDVVTEHAISCLLRPLSPNEREVWELDQRINARGVYVDVASVDDALHIIDDTVATLNAEVQRITNGELDNVSQRVRVMNYIADLGYPMEKFDKGAIEQALNDDELPPLARRLLGIRQQTGKTSTAKYTALKQIVSKDSRAHGLLMYHGASTGRWSGRLFQPQNLPRPSFDNTDACISLLHHRDGDILAMLFDEPMEALSSCLRGMITAPAGKRLLVADYSAIEARVLAWLAGQKDVIEVFRGHGKIYEHTATQIYGVRLEDVTKEQRFIGKVATLALGYQGGQKAFQGMAEAYGVEIGDELAEKVKNDWREANANIVQFWWDVDKAAINAVKNPGTTFKARGVAFRAFGKFLYCKLPSGRYLAYADPNIGVGRFDNPQVTFRGTNSVTRKWERQETYGGKLVENITQAVARDLMAQAMLRVERAGYEVVLSVHDELIAERADDEGSIEEFNALMCELPTWAIGLPVEADGFECKRYRK